jgi:hypothetical protein
MPSCYQLIVMTMAAITVIIMVVVVKMIISSGCQPVAAAKTVVLTADQVYDGNAGSLDSFNGDAKAYLLSDTE